MGGPVNNRHRNGKAEPLKNVLVFNSRREDQFLAVVEHIRERHSGGAVTLSCSIG
ncbi:hypothetical protein ACFLT7_02630 [candidate division KSB1 bacterium]